MDKNQFITLLNNPNLLLYVDKFEVERIIKEYPYFSSAYLLLAKKLQVEKHPDFGKRLSFIAAHVPDRKQFFSYINGVPTAQNIVAEKTSPVEIPNVVEGKQKDVSAETFVKEEISIPAIVDEKIIALEIPAVADLSAETFVKDEEKKEKLKIPAIEVPEEKIIVPAADLSAEVSTKAEETPSFDWKMKETSSAPEESIQQFKEKLQQKNEEMSELEKMLEQNRAVRRKLLGLDEEKPKIVDVSVETSVKEEEKISAEEKVVELTEDEISQQLLLAENERVEHELSEVESFLEHVSGGDVSEMQNIIVDEENFDNEELELIPVADEAGAAISLEEEIVLEKEREENEFKLFSETGAGEFIQTEIEEENEDELVEENFETEVEAMEEIEHELISNEINSMAKEYEMELIGAAEFAHKDELTEPDDDRLFEEKFDTEIESLKTMDAETTSVLEEKVVEEIPVAEEEEKEIESVEEENSIEEIVEDEVIETEPHIAAVEIPKNEKHSFVEWLQFFNGNKILKSGNPETSITVNLRTPEKEIEEKPFPIEFTHDIIQVESPEELEHIDKLVTELKTKQTPNQNSTAKNSQEKAEESVTENHDFITETLAKVYEMQGKYAKAISIYSRLSLKYPEKSRYFATLIKELKSKF